MKRTIVLLGFIIFMVIVSVIAVRGVVREPQVFTKHLGGNTTIDLPAGKQLIPYTVQWEPKSSNIWYLTAPMDENHEPTTYTFHESSSFGALEGTIEFVEHR